MLFREKHKSFQVNWFVYGWHHGGAPTTFVSSRARGSQPTACSVSPFRACADRRKVSEMDLGRSLLLWSEVLVKNNS